MTRSRQFIRSWSGGIISPELFGRLDDARYHGVVRAYFNNVAQEVGV